MSFFGRIKQFFRAITAKVTVEDGKYISAHLNAEEQKIFFAMSIVDQCHSLHTAYTIERLIIEDKRGANVVTNTTKIFPRIVKSPALLPVS